MRLAVETCGDLQRAMLRLQQDAARYELVIVNISNPTKPWARIIHDLQEAAFHSSRQLGPFFLCVSSSRQPPELRLALEREGARFVYEK
ncbi:MAG TPA: hypothetical protein VGT24_13670 [Candidatus Acidoferrales bacterium]|nr:hypothetical protein [Candidatus Acidoferrales bacterium]